MPNRDQELLDALKVQPKAKPRALMDAVLASYGANARQGLEVALANPGWTSAAVRKVLGDNAPSESAIHRFRKDRYGL